MVTTSDYVPFGFDVTIRSTGLTKGLGRHLAKLISEYGDLLTEEVGFCGTDSLAKQPDIYREQIEEHLAYLKRMASDGVVRQDHAHRARTVWLVAWFTVGGKLPVPAASAVEKALIEYFWERDSHQLSVIIPGDGDCQWFYRNNATGEICGDDFPVDHELPVRLVGYLERLVQSPD